MTPEGDYVDFQNEDNRNPEEKPAQNLNNFLAESGANRFILHLDSQFGYEGWQTAPSFDEGALDMLSFCDEMFT